MKRLQHVEKLRQEGVDPATVLDAQAPTPPCTPVLDATSVHKRSVKAVEAADTFTSSGLSASELEAMVEHITEVHRQHTPHTAEFFAMLPQKEKEFLVTLCVNCKTFIQ